MQLLVGDPTFIEDLLVLLRLLLWSKHEKVPVHFFYKQLQASGSCCCHSRERACTAMACSAPSTCTPGPGPAGQEELSVHTDTRPLFCSYLSAADGQRKGAGAALEAGPSMTMVYKEKPLPPAEWA